MSGFVLRVGALHYIRGRGNVAWCTVEATPLPTVGETVAIFTAAGTAANVVVTSIERRGFGPVAVGDSVGLVIRGDVVPVMGSAVTPVGGHAPDCDGFRTAHWGTVVKVSNEGRGMWEARCFHNEGTTVSPGFPHWQGMRVGPGALDSAWQQANRHSEEVPCDGRCLAK